MVNQEKIDRVSSLIHDLRQPLNVLRLASGNIRNRIKLGGEEIDLAYLSAKLDAVDQQIANAARLLSQISDEFR